MLVASPMHTGIKMSRDVNLGFLTSSLTFTQDTTTQGVTYTQNASKRQSSRSTLWEAKGPHSHKIWLELTRDVVVFRNVKWDRGRYLYPTTYAGSHLNHFKEKHRFGKKRNRSQFHRKKWWLRLHYAALGNEATVAFPQECAELRVKLGGEDIP